VVISLSVELPEAQILAKQMNKELLGKQVKAYKVENSQKLQKLGFINKDLSNFNHLIKGKIEKVVSRGNVIHVKLDKGMNLILAPEYGGKILYHAKNSTVPEKFHLKLDFTDGSALTVALTGMGVILALRDDELERSYVYRRDFSVTASPTDDKEFTYESFSKDMTDKSVNIKSVLVGKDAVIVGFSNSTFQDILYRAGIHPKRKASDLSENEKHRLYDAIKWVIQQRIASGGKEQFADIYGKQGSYSPAMGPNMKDKTCSTCGSKVEKLSLGGGQVYYCPGCQQ
jgi:formamidopyrimidine-DNA glycosylase